MKTKNNFPKDKNHPGYKHGDSGSSEYGRWEGMWSRCTSKSNKKYHRYGGRGITVCERWKDYEMFLKDMGRCPKNYSLDRIDVNGNYEPTNCRWATQKVQQNNRANNRSLTINGITKLVTEWAEISGVSSKVIRQRLDRDNCSPEDAIRPVQSQT